MAKASNGRQRAESAVRESKHLAFKPGFDPKNEGDWCEIIKDLIAMANSSGGIVLFGLESDGTPSGIDPADVVALNLAQITDKIFRYTGVQFDDLEVIQVERANGLFAGISVEASRTPIPFTNAGSYTTSGGLPKSAFAKGTVYFRHGAKSEPAKNRDFVAWRDRELARVRSEWMGGIRKVVSTRRDRTVTLLPSRKGASPTVDVVVHGQISEAGRGQAVAVTNAEEIWPYRQKDLLREVNRMIRPQRMTSYDVQCANRKFDVKNRSDLRYKSHRLAAPQYSKAYLELLVEGARSDPDFVTKLRQEFRLSSGIGSR